MPAGDYRRNLERLCQHQKSGRGAPPYSLLVNRPLGRRIAAAAGAVGLTPNAVSLISASMTASALAVLCLAAPTVLTAVAVVVLLLVAYAVDSADGQLARLTNGGTLAGEWLDHSLDVVKVASFHAAILISAFRFDRSSGDWPLLTAIGFGVVAVASFFIMVLTDQLRRKRSAVAPPRPRSAWFLVLIAPTDYGVQCLWLLTRPSAAVFFAGYALLFAANTAYLVAGALSRFGQLQQLDREIAAAADETLVGAQ